MDPDADVGPIGALNNVDLPGSPGTNTARAEPSGNVSGVALSRNTTSPTPLILSISPARGGGQTGYIYLDAGEDTEENAL